MTAPVIGQVNERGVPNNEWDVYWYNQNHANDVTNPAGTQGAAAQSGIQMYGSPQEQQGEGAARNNASIYYGSSAELGADAADYRNRIKSAVGKPSALASQISQAANTQIGRENAKAGMSGVNRAPAMMRESRSASIQSDQAQQAQDTINNANYGKAIGAGIAGTESLAAGGAGRAIASTPTQTANYGSSCPMCIVATQLFLNRDISKADLLSVMEAGRSFDKDAYAGYILLAQPFLNTKSNFLKRRIIPAFKTYANGNPNLFAKLMILSSKIVGFLYLKTGSDFHLRLLKKATVNDLLMKKELSC